MVESGLLHRFAKAASLERGSEGSNPSPSAKVIMKCDYGATYEGKYIWIRNIGRQPGAKTARFEVWSKSPCRIGMIKWYPAWRCYSYFPDPNTLYEKVCLREIADFCEEVTRQQKIKII